MDASHVQLVRTELEFLTRLVLDLQRRLGDGGAEGDAEMVAALELALAVLHWDGEAPPELDAQVGLGASVQMRLGGDGMVAWRQWRDQCRKRHVLTP